MMLLKVLIFIFTTTISLLSYSQFEFKEVDILYHLQSVHKYFLYCQDKKDTTFTGNDTIFLLLNDTTLSIDTEKIKVVVMYRKGIEYKAVGYYNNGQKYREANFCKGVLTGSSTIWYKNGNMNFLAFYADDGKDILSFSFYKNGQIEDYINSNIGFSKSWYKSGELKEEDIFDSIQYHETKYYKNGQIESIGIFNNGKQPIKMFYKNGQIALSGYIYNVHLLALGKWSEWYVNGQLKREYYFNDSIPNQKESIWKWWNEKGKLIKKEIYKDGQLISSEEFRIKKE